MTTPLSSHPAGRHFLQIPGSTNDYRHDEWGVVLESNRKGYWPYTPATNRLYGLQAALDYVVSARAPTKAADRAA